MAERHEIEAWLGDDHGLDEDQIRELMRQADDIAERYPDEDDIRERDEALTTAYRVLAGDQHLVEELRDQLVRARSLEAEALASLGQAARMMVPDTESQSGFARRAGVDRMTVRQWLDLEPHAYQ